MSTVPAVPAGKVNDLGVRLFSLFSTHVTERKPAEERWLQNMRQFRGIYDPEVKIPADCSKAYPKLTRKVIIGTVAKLMQMLFPQTEENFGVSASPMPDLPLDQLQQILDELVAEKSQAQGIDPAAVILEDEEIEKAILAKAKKKSERMELKIKDDLREMEYITLARRVVFSATLYNLGLVRGPLNNKVKARTWQKNANTGKYEAKEVDKFKPLFEFQSIWDHYPDMSAKTLGAQDGAFDRHIMTRAQVEELADRPDFMGDVIRNWLNEHATGNYKPQWWETIIKSEPKSDRQHVKADDRKYEILSYWGGVTGHELRAAGISVSDAEVGRTFQANAWTIGNVVIKLKLSPLSKVKHHHYFVFEEDDLSLLGNGQGDTIRDSQLSLCEVQRAALDNASVVGPNVVINDDHLSPGQNTSVRKHKTWHVEDLPSTASIDNAIKNLTIDSHIGELLALRNAILDFAAQEVGLPPASLGDVGQGGSEALRTQGNASMFLGAAALPIRDTVRNFDSFTMSVINALVQWNMKFDPNPSRDGDHDIIARGSTSLIAKEVLAQSLDAVRQTVTQDELPHIKARKLLVMRLKARDVPVDEILEDEETAQATIDRAAKAQAEAQQQQAALVEAQVHEVLAKAVKNIAGAAREEGKTKHDAAQLLLDAISQGHSNAIAEHSATKPEAKGGGK